MTKLFVTLLTFFTATGIAHARSLERLPVKTVLILNEDVEIPAHSNWINLSSCLFAFNSRAEDRILAAGTRLTVQNSKVTNFSQEGGIILPSRVYFPGLGYSGQNALRLQVNGSSSHLHLVCHWSVEEQNLTEKTAGFLNIKSIPGPRPF